jgi:hypothetical protein
MTELFPSTSSKNPVCDYWSSPVLYLHGLMSGYCEWLKIKGFELITVGKCGFKINNIGSVFSIRVIHFMGRQP